MKKSQSVETFFPKLILDFPFFIQFVCDLLVSISTFRCLVLCGCGYCKQSLDILILGSWSESRFYYRQVVTTSAVTTGTIRSY